MSFLIWAFAGILAGFSSGLLGIGGGLILVPVLHFMFARDPATAPLAMHFAVATSLATMLFTSAGSILAHQRKGAILWDVFRQLLPGLLLGAALGAVAADRLNGDILGMVFGIYATLAGIQLLTGAQPLADRPLPGRFVSACVGTGIGAVSALSGIGGGSLTVPWLLWHKIRPSVAVATSAACGYPIAVAGTIAFVLLGRGAVEHTAGSWTGYVHGPAFASIVVFSLAAAPLGAAAVHRLPANWVRQIFGVFLLLVALRMLSEAIQ